MINQYMVALKIKKKIPDLLHHATMLLSSHRGQFKHDLRFYNALDNINIFDAMMPHLYTTTLSVKTGTSHTGVYRYKQRKHHSWGQIIIYPYHNDHIVRRNISTTFAHELAHGVHENIIRVKRNGHVIGNKSFIADHDAHNTTWYQIYAIFQLILNKILPPEHRVYIADITTFN